MRRRKETGHTPFLAPLRRKGPGHTPSLARLRDERGDVAITQLLVTVALATIVLGASLGVFETFVSASSETDRRNAIQDQARSTVDRLARELRNLASPTQEQPRAVDRATAYDIVFQTVDALGPNSGLNASNVKRVRYCLNTDERRNGRLYYQEQRWTTLAPPPAPGSTACPAAGWQTQRQVAERIVNRRDGLERAMFAFNSAEATEISALHADVIVDDDTARDPAETRLSTGVFLRNQNRRPVASFTATREAAGTLLLNGSASYDPEGEQLEYVWFDGATKVGTGITFKYAVEPGSVHSMSLKVYDAATLEGVAPAQTVTA